MMRMIKHITTDVEQSVALDYISGAIMLTLSDGDGHVFRQALNACDVGKLLDLFYVANCEERILCQGDLTAKAFTKEYNGLHLTWHDDKGGEGLVQFDKYNLIVFKEALRSCCLMLMRSHDE